jgi:hypothetical protein
VGFEGWKILQVRDETGTTHQLGFLSEDLQQRVGLTGGFHFGKIAKESLDDTAFRPDRFIITDITSTVLRSFIC